MRKVAFAAAAGAAALLFAWPAGEIQFSERLISRDYTYAYGIHAADLDGDGDLDLVSADAREHAALYWYENDGKGSFTRHTIFAHPQVMEQELVRMERHVTADINGDGRLDIVIVDNSAGDVRWFENSGTPRDGKPWRLHTITRGTLPGAYDVAVADIDGDGDLDVAASSWRLGNQFVWFENPGKHGPRDETQWVRHQIDTDLAETRTVQLGDLNGDGRPDLLATATAAGLVLWYENPGKAGGGRWKRHVIDTTGRPAHGEMVDMDGDGDLDVTMASGMAATMAPSAQPINPQVAWYENTGRGAGWKKHVVSELPEGFEAVAADIDGDGLKDLVATAWGKGGGVVWFRNPGPAGGQWKATWLKRGWTNANQIIVADFDKDGRPDVAAAADKGTNEVRWWRNQGPR